MDSIYFSETIVVTAEKISELRITANVRGKLRSIYTNNGLTEVAST